ncbi:hypothetical protein ACP70R_030514 [Stipagrostis hirtigluma subsp. patula]
MEMAAAWTVLVGERAVEVVVRCVRGRRELAAAATLLALPTHAADAPLARARLQLVRSMLSDASVELALAASAATAAELLALRGATDHPAAPPLSVHRVPDGDLFARFALSLLQGARGCADDACDAVQRCGGHLRTAVNLLGCPGLHGIDGFLDAERAAAHGDLAAAKNLALVSAVLAITAHLFVCLAESRERSTSSA